ncbi:MAG TPA: dihydrolipoyl dehydrogenase [Pantanalinema sp.]
MQNKKVEALVIGAGPGGYVAAIRLAQLGKKVLLVEKAQLGGVCLNVGCIPSKALITAAKTVEKLKKVDQMGITVGGFSVDFPKMIGWKDGIVKKLTGGVGQLVKGNGGEVLYGTATFKTANQVEVMTNDGPVLVVAQSVIVATGSRPIEIPGFAFDGRRVISSTEALSLSEIPKRLVVIGGGYIGLEMGMMYAKLGAQVTVVERLGQVLPGFDPEIAQLLGRQLKKLGVEVLLDTAAKGYVDGPMGARVQLEQNGKPLEVEADRILVTVGRRPNSEGLGLERVGVRIDARGFVSTDKQMRTNVPGIYAIGDLAGQPMLAHKASKEAEVAAEVIAGHPAAMDVKAIPAVVFTDPEIGSVGLSEAEAKAQGFDAVVGKFPFAALGRAMTTGETEGFVKVVADRKTQEVLGVHIVGPEASNLVAEAGLALEMGAFIDDLSLTVHAHPTLAEGIMEAAKAAIGEAIHVMNKDTREPAAAGR